MRGLSLINERKQGNPQSSQCSWLRVKEVRARGPSLGAAGVRSSGVLAVACGLLCCKINRKILRLRRYDQYWQGLQHSTAVLSCVNPGALICVRWALSQPEGNTVASKRRLTLYNTVLALFLFYFRFEGGWKCTSQRKLYRLVIVRETWE